MKSKGRSCSLRPGRLEKFLCNATISHIPENR
jgi:hypothetical protein